MNVFTVLYNTAIKNVISIDFLNNMEETQAYVLIIVFKNQDTTLGRELIITFKKCIGKKKVHQNVVSSPLE